ncbi:MAG: TMEM165/GDT1 family protein [Candidatus Methanofastidiosia archaeon]|jgi:putative Ca2+/H+ antiporter (TMEM165/GDT1 family)
MKELLSIIGLFFIMELGDKTMLTSLALAAKYNPWIVFFGALIGLGLVTGLSVTIGQTVSQYVSPETIQKVSGALFIIIGILVWAGKL